MHSLFGSFFLLGVIIFGSVSKLVFFFLNWNRTGSSLVWFGYFRTKTGLARFNFFGFRFRKPNPNWTGQFLKNSNWFNWFFSRFGFFGYFFLFSWFNHYFSFFAHPCFLRITTYLSFRLTCFWIRYITTYDNFLWT